MLSFAKGLLPRSLWLLLGRCRLRASHAINLFFLARFISSYNTHLVQVGAGASSLDERMPHPEGFHHIVSTLSRSYRGDISLYEPNPVNIDSLTESWSKCPFNFTIYPEAISIVGVQTLTFYYHPDDAPHFQCCSIDPAHVLRHYPSASLQDLKTFAALSNPLESILSRTLQKENNSLFLALDIEGLDFSICSQIFQSGDLHLIAGFSIEILNMTKDEYEQVNHLAGLNGFHNIGVGLDFHCWDRLFLRSTYSPLVLPLSLLSRILLVDRKLS